MVAIDAALGRIAVRTITCIQLRCSMILQSPTPREMGQVVKEQLAARRNRDLAKYAHCTILMCNACVAAPGQSPVAAKQVANLPSIHPSFLVIVRHAHYWHSRPFLVCVVMF